jgi:hypothetical protein
MRKRTMEFAKADLVFGGSDSALCGPLSIPMVVAREIDVFPPEWREVFEKLKVVGLAVAGAGLNDKL